MLRDRHRDTRFGLCKGDLADLLAVYIRFRFGYKRSKRHYSPTTFAYYILHPYNVIRLVGCNRCRVSSYSQGPCPPSLSAAPVTLAAAPGPPLRQSGRSGRVVVHPWPSPRRAMNIPARCAGCPEPPATPASRPAARREASRKHGPPPVAADAKLGRAGKLPRE